MSEVSGPATDRPNALWTRQFSFGRRLRDRQAAFLQLVQHQQPPLLS
ncbi:MAG TPA: hypothetical protein VNH38_04355 [Candidatus Dormibacteraeota bacterium]|nr:hypothetical protein [Candidatus Dormibacteraeota bacterium]